jgi:hypothetical protein
MRLDIKTIRVEFIRDSLGEVLTIDLNQNLTPRRVVDEYGLPVELTEEELKKIRRRIVSRLTAAYNDSRDS